ncbi:MAG: DUF4907 domain-containing protein [Bacteroidota bacterium]
MRSVLSFFFLFLAFSLNSLSNPDQQKGSAKFPDGKTQKSANYTYTIIPAENKTWCYDIYMDKKLFIHQSSIPGLPGNEGFKTKADAEKIAKLVIDKIKKGEMPPSITIEEMKKLKVL